MVAGMALRAARSNLISLGVGRPLSHRGRLDDAR
jgi:hypothetical protein